MGSARVYIKNIKFHKVKAQQFIRIIKDHKHNADMYIRDTFKKGGKTAMIVKDVQVHGKHNAEEELKFIKGY